MLAAARLASTACVAYRQAAWLPNPVSTLAAPAATIGSHGCCALRLAATKPEATVYSGPTANAATRVNLRVLRRKYDSGQKLTMVTAYDYPSAAHVRCCQPLIGHV